MSSKESILKKEIRLPKITIPAFVPELLASLCVGSFMIAALVMAILAMYHHSIDYTAFKYQVIYEYYLHPLTTAIGIAALLCAILQRKNDGVKVINWIKRSRTCVFFLILTIWIMLSTVVNGTNFITRFGAGYLGETLFSVIKYFVILFPCAAIVINSNTKAILLRLFLFTSVVLVIAAFFLWQTQIESKFIIGWKPSFTSIFTNTNYYGYFLSVSVPLSAVMFTVEEAKTWKIFSGFSLIANTVALSFNNTMGAWMGCFFACVSMLTIYKIRDGRITLNERISFYIYLFTFIAVSLFNGNLATNILSLFFDMSHLVNNPLSEESLHAGSGRWIIWLHTLEQIGNHPIFGIGHEGVIVRDLAELVGNNRPHNEYLQYALFYGIPAGILYFVGCASLYLRAIIMKTHLDNLTLAALVAAFGYLVGGFFGLTLYSSTPFLFIMLGLGYVHVPKD